jgi:CRISPR/Cas system-associated protein Cas5 (RAMP superfamily)
MYKQKKDKIENSKFNFENYKSYKAVLLDFSPHDLENLYKNIEKALKFSRLVEIPKQSNIYSIVEKNEEMIKKFFEHSNIKMFKVSDSFIFYKEE